MKNEHLQYSGILFLAATIGCWLGMFLIDGDSYNYVPDGFFLIPSCALSLIFLITGVTSAIKSNDYRTETRKKWMLGTNLLVSSLLIFNLAFTWFQSLQS